MQQMMDYAKQSGLCGGFCWQHRYCLIMFSTLPKMTHWFGDQRTLFSIGSIDPNQAISSFSAKGGEIFSFAPEKLNAAYHPGNKWSMQQVHFCRSFICWHNCTDVSRIN
ncbi:MAG: hypothetical protein R2865_05840 [Deinococcales bacterium]